jgi:hypothetical protein
MLGESVMNAHMLGVDLSDITTHAHLQAGIAYALGTLGLEIRPAAHV